MASTKQRKPTTARPAEESSRAAAEAAETANSGESLSPGKAPDRISSRTPRSSAAKSDESSEAPPSKTDRVAPPKLPARYRDLGRVGSGFGEVRRVVDTAMDRTLVMKLLHKEASSRPIVRKRFFTEIQITAQLQHPGIVPVYDQGELRDGRLWYTMKEVRGITFAAIFKDFHATSDVGATDKPPVENKAPPPDSPSTTASGWTFRRVVDAFARVAQTVAYAHANGVVHRDLKPENLMAGEFGEVLVMDWGLARRVHSSDVPPSKRRVPAARATQKPTAPKPTTHPPQSARKPIHRDGSASTVASPNPVGLVRPDESASPAAAPDRSPFEVVQTTSPPGSIPLRSGSNHPTPRIHRGKGNIAKGAPSFPALFGLRGAGAPALFGLGGAGRRRSFSFGCVGRGFDAAVSGFFSEAQRPKNEPVGRFIQVGKGAVGDKGIDGFDPCVAGRDEFLPVTRAAGRCDEGTFVFQFAQFLGMAKPLFDEVPKDLFEHRNLFQVLFHRGVRS